jgi:YHS domain-containing protein
MHRFITTVLVILAWSVSEAQVQQLFKVNGVASNGYDVVAYFKEHAAIKGSDQFAATWEGAQWWFSSKENLEAFKQNPQSFAPQFGGYCAYGVSENHKAPTEPTAFTIVDGKLYLNYNLSVREKWAKDTKGYITRAEGNWPALKLQD